MGDTSCRPTSGIFLDGISDENVPVNSWSYSHTSNTYCLKKTEPSSHIVSSNGEENLASMTCCVADKYPPYFASSSNTILEMILLFYERLSKQQIL